MNVPGGPGKLPLAIRNMALACMALSALVGFFSLTELLALIQPNDPTRLPLQLPGTFGSEAFKKGVEAQRAAVEAMRVARVLTLSGLGLACALNFVAASRLIWPRGLRRESMRRLVVGSSVAVALLRTLDGAQLTVVARRVGGAMGRSANSLPGLDGLPRSRRKLRCVRGWLRWPSCKRLSWLELSPSSRTTSERNGQSSCSRLWTIRDKSPGPLTKGASAECPPAHPSVPLRPAPKARSEPAEARPDPRASLPEAAPGNPRAIAIASS